MNRVVLGDIAEIITGPFGSMLHKSDYVEEGFPLVMPQDIGDRIINFDSIAQISEIDAIRLEKYEAVENDIIYARRGDVEKHAFVVSEYGKIFCGTGCLRVRVNPEKANPLFISFYLSRPECREWISKHAVGSNMPNINTEILSDVPIELPDKAQQQKVVDFLSATERKILHNRKINDNLLQQLQLIYNYWFTQFDFPSKENHPYNASGGDMVRNEQVKRNIPANWEVKSLGELCLFRNGINYDKSIEGEKTYKIINVRNISSTDIMLNENELDEIRLPQKQGDKYCVSAESIIIARSGIPGSTRILYKPSNNTIFCGFVISCTPIDSDMQYYLTFYLKQLESSSATKTGGSILQNVSQDTLSNLIVPIPPKEILGKFNQIVSQTFELFHENLKETSRLVKLRDWLLPLLMNGQATIDD